MEVGVEVRGDTDKYMDGVVEALPSPTENGVTDKADTTPP